MIWTIIGIVEVKSGQILSFCKYYHNCLIHTVDWVIWWIVIMPIKWNYKLELCSRLEIQWMYNHAFWYVSYQYSLINIHDHMLLLWVLVVLYWHLLCDNYWLPFSAIFSQSSLANPDFHGSPWLTLDNLHFLAIIRNKGRKLTLDKNSTTCFARNNVNTWLLWIKE